MTDTKRLIAEVAARHGICLGSDDPALALITLNELVLDDAIQNAVALVRAANKDFEDASEQLQARAGAFLAQQISRAIATGKSEFAGNVDEATAKALEKLSKLHQFHASFAIHWIVAGILGALVI